jgi:hypothetical protein
MSRINGFVCIATFLLLPPLAGCGSAGLFGTHELPESPGVADAPWPRLVDTPAAPAKGEYAAGVPDPTEGAAALSDLGLAARDAAARAEALAGPVLTEAERRRLTRRR